MRQGRARPDADVLRVGTDPGRRVAEHRVADLELRHVRADSFDVTRELDPERAPSRPAEPDEQPPQEGIGATKVRVALR